MCLVLRFCTCLMGKSETKKKSVTDKGTCSGILIGLLGINKRVKSVVLVAWKKKIDRGAKNHWPGTDPGLFKGEVWKNIFVLKHVLEVNFIIYQHLWCYCPIFKFKNSAESPEILGDQMLLGTKIGGTPRPPAWIHHCWLWTRFVGTHFK